MKYTVPDYYKEFACLAGACPTTCCAGWQIEIDQQSINKYRRFSRSDHPFKNRLHNGVNWASGTFVQDSSKRCDFLNEENLCDIYSEAGKRMLCKTCRTYPRHIEEFEGLRELSLSLSCPEAARIILNLDRKVVFLSKDTEKEEQYEYFDYLLFSQLMDARDYLTQTVQNRAVPTGLRMAKILVYANDIGLNISSGKAYRCDEIKERHHKRGFGADFTDKLHKYPASFNSSLELVQRIWSALTGHMEVLQDDWPAYLAACRQRLYGRGTAFYQEQLRAFSAAYPAWEITCEQLLLYWLYTYFCGALYDGHVCAKVKSAVLHTLLIRELSIARFIENDSCFCTADLEKICVRYSRELEHSDPNLLCLDRLTAVDPLFRLGNLLALI